MSKKPKGERVYVTPGNARWLRHFAARQNLTCAQWVNRAIELSVEQLREELLRQQEMAKTKEDK